MCYTQKTSFELQTVCIVVTVWFRRLLPSAVGLECIRYRFHSCRLKGHRAHTYSHIRLALLFLALNPDGRAAQWPRNGALWHFDSHSLELQVMMLTQEVARAVY